MSLFGTVLTISPLLLSVFWWFKIFRRRRLFHYASKIDGPPALPLIGSSFYFFCTSKQLVKNAISLTKRYKSPWKMWLGSELYIVLSKPEDIEIVLNQSLERGEIYKFLKPLLGDGLVTANAEKWKQRRRVIRNAFKMPVLTSYVQVFSRHSENLVEELDKSVGSGVFDLYPVMNRHTLNITLETSLGSDFIGSSEFKQYSEVLANALHLIFCRFFAILDQVELVWKLRGKFRQVNELCGHLHATLQTIVATKRQETNPDSKCFLDHLIKLAPEWSITDLMNETQNMTAAGSDSLGLSSSSTLLMLGLHPSVQDKVYEELFEIYGHSNRSVTYEDLPKMTYLELVIKETLRFFPLSAAIARKLHQDLTTSDGQKLPRGCQCLIAIATVHRDATIWKEPFQFKPERFTSEEVAKRHPYSYIPFSAGPRNCIGFKYAMMAIKTIVANVVRRYRISTDFRNVLDVEIEPGIVLKPVKGHRVSLERRFVNHSPSKNWKEGCLKTSVDQTQTFQELN